MVDGFEAHAEAPAKRDSARLDGGSSAPAPEHRPGKGAQRQAYDGQACDDGQGTVFEQLESFFDELRQRYDPSLTQLKNADTKEAGRQKQQGIEVAVKKSFMSKVRLRRLSNIRRRARPKCMR